MKLVPAHRISYKGTFYKVGDVVEIDDADADDMRKYGKVIFEDFAEREPKPVIFDDIPAEPEISDDIPTNPVAETTPPPRRSGRPRKV